MAITGGGLFRAMSKQKDPSGGRRKKELLKKHLKTARAWTGQRLFIFTCYAYIFGVMAGMYFFQVPVSHMSHALYAACGLATLSAALLYFKPRHSLTALCLAVCAVGLGIYRYSAVLDTTDPGHLVHFAKEGFDERVDLTGVIIQDPDVRERYTNCVVQPETLITDEDEKVQVTQGLVLVRLYPDNLESYGQYSYGDKIQVRGPLSVSRPLTNPGGFDYRHWLNSRGIYAVMYARRDRDISKLGRGDINPLVNFALKMKEKFIQTIRETVPYPESSFLGGVTLGLKGGVGQEMRFEFQSTGIAHVLAVSGLHVGFVAVLLILLANLFKIPDKFQPIFIMLGLLIFAIITGASPATVRACIMFSLLVSINTYMTGMGLAASTLLTIPIAAVAILAMNPLLLMDASFLLSFGAVLSLGLLTSPVNRLFSYIFVGFRLIAGAVIIVLLTWIAHSNWDAFFSAQTAPQIFGGLAAIFALSCWLQKLYPNAIRFGFSSLNYWFASFICAQVAINLGNSPLFAFYFYRISISGWYANFIAIPLCGLIVQMGLLADLLYLIPYAGPYLGAIVNGGNYLMCKFFLAVAHFFASNFPYPYAGTPTVKFSAWYYGALFVFVYHRYFWNRIKTVYTWWQYRDQMPEVRGKLYAALGAAGLLVACIPSYYYMESRAPKLLQVTFFEVGKSSSTVIQTPGGRAVLVDGGAYDVDRNFDVGQNTIAPAFSDYGINFIDHVVLTGFHPEHLGGLPYVCSQFHVRNFIDCLPPALADASTPWDTFAARLADGPYKTMTESKYTDDIFESYRNLLAVLESRGIPRTHPDGPRALIEEQTPNGPLKITVIAPPDTGLSIPRRTSLVRVEHGDLSFLLTGDIDPADLDAVAARVDSGVLRSTFLLMPSHGESLSESFLDAVSPVYAVIQTRTPFRRRGATEARGPLQKTLESLESRNIRVYQTESQGAIIVKTDGKGISIKPFAS